MTTQATPSDKIRYTLIVSKDTHEKLTEITKQFKLSQAEVFEILVERADLQQLDPIFTAKREQKVNVRSNSRALINKLTKLTPEQLAVLNAMSEGN